MFHAGLITLALLAGGCARVSELSDEASVVEFTITGITPGEARVEGTSVGVGRVEVSLVPREGLFPVTFQATARASRTTVDVLGFPDEFRFEQGDDVITFYLVAESGVARAVEVRLVPVDTGADVLSFSVPGTAGVTATVDAWNAAVSISAGKLEFPLTITPVAGLSPGATAAGLPASITFERASDVKRFTVSAGDGAVAREWSLSVAGLVQLPNSGFERWLNEGTTDVNIDPAPGKTWGTANNFLVQGTRPVEHAGGRAAMMTTGIQAVPIFNHALVTAGTIYTGHFVLGMNFENPRAMTFFGVPHAARPVAVAFEARYVAGPRLQRSEKNAAGRYEVRDIDGHDNGEAWAELLHWGGSGALEYHGGTPPAGLTVLGRGSVTFDGSDTRLHEWGRVEMPVVYDTGVALEPTHIVVVFSSSKKGDLFEGADGSRLEVDNVELLY
jgi:hypothetical protein